MILVLQFYIMDLSNLDSDKEWVIPPTMQNNEILRKSRKPTQYWKIETKIKGV